MKSPTIKSMLHVNGRDIRRFPRDFDAQLGFILLAPAYIGVASKWKRSSPLPTEAIPGQYCRRAGRAF